MRMQSLLVATILALCTFLAGSNSIAHAESVLAVVAKVADGDTVTCYTEQGTKLKIRLYGIDAPEVRHPNKPGQPWGQEAKAALEGKVMRKTVTVETRSVDRYKRVVAIIRLGNRDINQEMVEEGNSWAYRQYLDRPYASTYLSAEGRARAARRGIWRQNNPQPPWEFRKNN